MGHLGPLSPVTFDSVEINEHPITLGSNPSVADGGPPIEIEWQAQSYEVTTVDDFEDSRAEKTTTTSANSSKSSVRKLSPQERMNLLIKAGFSEEDLNKNEDEVSSIRLMREMSKRRSQRSAAATAAASPSGTSATTTQDQQPKETPSSLGKPYRTMIKAFRLRRNGSVEIKQ